MKTGLATCTCKVSGEPCLKLYAEACCGGRPCFVVMRSTVREVLILAAPCLWLGRACRGSNTCHIAILSPRALHIPRVMQALSCGAEQMLHAVATWSCDAGRELRALSDCARAGAGPEQRAGSAEPGHLLQPAAVERAVRRAAPERDPGPAGLGGRPVHRGRGPHRVAGQGCKGRGNLNLLRCERGRLGGRPACCRRGHCCDAGQSCVGPHIRPCQNRSLPGRARGPAHIRHGICDGALQSGTGLQLCVTMESTGQGSQPVHIRH